jgi:hypothetical protein
VASLGSNLAVCLILGVSLNNVWQLMNTIQLLTLIPLFKLPIPPQFLSLCDSIMDFSNLDLIPEELSIKYIRRKLVGGKPLSNATKGRNLESEESVEPGKLDLNFEMMDIF